ncbi:MAG: MFS transporter [Candidatus Omnitrophica bacterium]|jgi:MFS family permease|nr:MFS transporter [Candidatus Omnitrophota bacterium]
MIQGYLKILRRKNFVFLWISQIIAQFGDRLSQMALIGLVYKLNPGSSLGLAKMFSLAIIPVFLISPISGVYVDRWDKRKTMYTSDFLRCLCIFFIPMAVSKFHSMPLVYFLIFLSFCVGRFFIPAKMAVIPSLVEKESFFMANSLVSITATIAAVLGFGFGGMIVQKWGVERAFFLNAITFLVSGILIAMMQMREKTKFDPKDILDLGKDAIVKVKNSFIFEIREGLKYILSSKETRYAAKVQFILFALIGSLYTVFIVFVQQTLGTVTFALGWLAVGSGAGLFIGSLFYGKIGSKVSIQKAINRSLFFSCFYLIAFVSLLRVYPYKLFAFISCFILGLVASPVVIAVNTLIHNESENKFWGRIFSSLEIIIHIAFIVFMFVASYLAEKFSPFTIIIAVGIITMILSCVFLKEKPDVKATRT